MTSSAESFTMRILNAISGAAAYGTASALSTVNCKLGMHALASDSRSLPQCGKESSNLPPDFRATRQPVPVHADETNQLVALIDRDEVILRRLRTSAKPNPIDEQGSHVGFHFVQDRVRLNNVRPRF